MVQSHGALRTTMEATKRRQLALIALHEEFMDTLIQMVKRGYVEPNHEHDNLRIYTYN